MDDSTARWLANRFRSHYKHQPVAPPIETVNWAWTDWRGTWHRVDAVPGTDALAREVQRVAPCHVYYYPNPIDAPGPVESSLPLALYVDIDIKVGAGVMEEPTLAAALTAAARHAVRFTTILEEEFGLNEAQAAARFSGGKGYHFLITASAWRNLSKDAKRQIVIQLSGVGADTHHLFPGPAGHVQLPTQPPAPGLAQRLWNGYHSALADLNAQDQRTLQDLVAALGHDATEPVLRAAIACPDPNTALQQSAAMANAMTLLARKRACVAIDGPVFTSPSHPPRMTNSLNGRTGLLCTAIPWSQISGFDPFIDANPHPDHPVRVYAPQKTTVEHSPHAAAVTLSAHEIRVLPASQAVPAMATGQVRLAPPRPHGGSHRPTVAREQP